MISVFTKPHALPRAQVELPVRYRYRDTATDQSRFDVSRLQRQKIEM